MFNVCVCLTTKNRIENEPNTLYTLYENEKEKKRKKEMPCDAHMLIGMGMIELKMHIYSGNVFDNLFD